jgi:two-component system nitrate/nitrite response regulator NarL
MRRYLRVVIADPHPVTLQGLSSVLGAERDFRVVACCDDGESCIEAIRIFVPDIAILDIAMPDIPWQEILVIANSESLTTRLVFFTAFVEDRNLMMLAATGGCDVISKEEPPEELVQTLRQIAKGPRMTALSSSNEGVSRAQSAIADKTLMTLTERERQIMRLVSEGLSNKEIGRRLNITDGTIKVHLHHVFQKLEISNRTVLAALAISESDADRLPETELPRGSVSR